jgi:hypothetical protein
VKRIIKNAARWRIWTEMIGISGYHQLEIGPSRIMVAVAPARCTTISDVTAGQRVWGLAAQIYGLRSAGDYGIGVFLFFKVFQQGKVPEL